MIAGYVFANFDLQRESINMYYEKPLTCPAMPTEQMGEASWRTANAVTMVLAAVGILLAMTFSRPWGERFPAWLIAMPLWIQLGESS